MNLSRLQYENKEMKVARLEWELNEAKEYL